MAAHNHQYSRIIIPIEDLEFSEAVIDFVADHQWSSDAQFRILHVRPPLSIMGSLGGMPVAIPQVIPSGMEGLEYARRLVDNVVRRLDLVESGRVEGFVKEGEPKEVIIRYAKAWPADLILMASHGRHGFEGWLMGSVSRTVAEYAPCSILVLYSKEASAAA